MKVYIPPTDRVVSSYDRCDDQELNSVVIDGLGKSTSKDTLWNYFENNRRSGGGPVTDVRFDDKRGVVYITFEHEAGKKFVQNNFERFKIKIKIFSIF